MLKTSTRLIFAILVCFSCKQQVNNDSKWTSLFNGENLDGWETYIGPIYNADSADFVGDHIGLNNDPNSVFKVVEVDGEKAIRISGEQFGGINTLSEFENYHLKLEFKWGEDKYAPKDSSKRDSGLLYHAGGPHAADWNFWMRSQEFQIQESDCGDYWGVAGGSFNVKVIKNENGDFVYNKLGESMTFNQASPIGRHAVKDPDNEKPTGEWNVLELYCKGDTAVHIMNGVVNMILTNSAYLNEDELVSLTKGKLQIQSEGAEVFYRNIQISDIDQIPLEILN